MINLKSQNTQKPKKQIKYNTHLDYELFTE